MQNDQERASLFIIRFIRLIKRLGQALLGMELEIRSFIATMALSHITVSSISEFDSYVVFILVFASSLLLSFILLVVGFYIYLKSFSQLVDHRPHYCHVEFFETHLGVSFRGPSNEKYSLNVRTFLLQALLSPRMYCLLSLNHEKDCHCEFGQLALSLVHESLGIAFFRGTTKASVENNLFS